MRNGEYGLGIDIGDATVAAAVCAGGEGGAAEPLLLSGDSATVSAAIGVEPDGGVLLGSAASDGTAVVSRLMARIGSPTPVYVGDRPVAAPDIVAAAVRRIRELAAEERGHPDSWTVLTVPPSWGGHRRAVLAQALAATGVPRLTLVSAAVAATHHLVATGQLPPEPVVAVYDLGASTLDTAVVGPMAGEPLAHLGVPPPAHPWGGRDVDDAVVGHVRRCLGAALDGQPARALRAACVRAKEALSSETAVRLEVESAENPGPVRLTREELDDLISGPARASLAAVAAALSAAGRSVEDLDGIVLAGGGVRVPAVAEVLSGELGRPLVVGPEPAMTAALGAAGLAADALAADALRTDAYRADARGMDACGTEDGPAGAAPPDVPPTEDAPTGGPDSGAVGDWPDPLPAGPTRRVTTVRRKGRHTAPAAAARPGPSRPPAAPRSPAGPGNGTTHRVRRGAVVAGLFLVMLLLPPIMVGVVSVDRTRMPEQSTAEAEDLVVPAADATTNSLIGDEATEGAAPAAVQEPLQRGAGGVAAVTSTSPTESGSAAPAGAAGSTTPTAPGATAATRPPAAAAAAPATGPSTGTP